MDFMNRASETVYVFAILIKIVFVFSHNVRQTTNTLAKNSSKVDVSWSAYRAEISLSLSQILLSYSIPFKFAKWYKI